MTFRFRNISTAALLLSSALTLSAFPQGGAGADPANTKISAAYQVEFAGINLGAFNVATSLADGQYAVQSSGKLKFISGILFEIQGGASSSGYMSDAGAKPVAFSFNFRTGKNKGGRMLMSFENGAVSEVESLPPLKLPPEHVPVTEKHVEGVLDPLSALFVAAASGKPGEGSICDQRVPVYDGLYRFDLQLSHKKSIRVLKKGKTGYAGPAVICKVKYVPVAGHNPRGANTVFMMENDDIEVWLIPLPEGGMYAPYHVSIPTPYGTAQATSTAFTIETANRKNIALVR